MANVTSGHKRKVMLPTAVLLGLVFYSLSAIAQVRVIDNKGTIQMVDTSKWKLNGNDIGNKNTGNVGIGTYAPMAKLHNTGATILGSVALTDFAANADVGTAAATVDAYSGAVITQTTAGITLSLPNPTNNPAGRVFQVSNAAASTQAITVQGVTIAPGSSALYRWDGAAWNTTTALANNIPLSGLTPAIAANSINNGDYAQVWNWNASTTTTPFTIATSSLTSGNLFSLTNTNASQTGSVFSLASNATAPTSGIANLDFSGNHTGNGLNITDATVAGNAFRVTANALTTGNAILVSNTGTALTSGALIKVSSPVQATTTGGILNVVNTAVSTTGKVATIQANTNAGSGVNVYANGNVGINTTSPAFTAPANTGANIPTFGVDGTINANNYTAPFQTLTDAATITWDLSKGPSATITLGATGRTLNITNAKNGMYGVLIVKQDATGSRTITTVQKDGVAATTKVVNGGTGVLSLTSTASAVDICSFFYDGTTFWWTIGYNFN